MYELDRSGCSPCASKGEFLESRKKVSVQLISCTLLSVQTNSNLKIPKTSIKTLMKEIHQNAIKYLTYLVLNKRKLKINKLLSHLPKQKGLKTNQ